MAASGLSLRSYALYGVGPIDSARIDAARFDRDAPPFGASLHRARLRRGSCAGAFLRPAFRYPRGGSRGLVGPLSASRSLVVFRPVNVAGTKPVACHACDGIAFDARFPTALVGFSDLALRRFSPAGGRGSRVSAPSDPHAVHRFIGRSVLAARPAGPVEALDVFSCFPHSDAPRERGGSMRRGKRTTPDGSVDRG